MSADGAAKKNDAKENVIILDIRDKNDLEEGRITESYISRCILEAKVGMASPGKIAKIIVYCELHLRGPLATRALNDLGYNTR